MPFLNLLYTGRHTWSWLLPSLPPSRVVGSFGSPAPMEGRALPPYLCVSSFGLVVSWWGGCSGVGLEAPPMLTLPSGWFTDGFLRVGAPAMARSHLSGLGPQTAPRYLASGGHFLGEKQNKLKKEKSHGMAKCTGGRGPSLLRRCMALTTLDSSKSGQFCCRGW